MTVDEQLVCFRGRCPFKQYIPSKPAKYGIKIWTICASTCYYAWIMQVYTGKDAWSARETNQGTRVVLDLVEDIENSGRNVNCDNFFTNLSLARKLLQKKLTLVGTMRKNNPELPTEFTVAKGRNVKSTVFGFQQDAMIASYCPKKTVWSICFQRCKVSQKSKALRIRNQALFCSTTKQKEMLTL